MSVIIRLQNLPLSANAANIRSFFQGLKIPDGGVNIVGGEDGDAFIAFATDDDARKAMLLNNQPINGAYVRLLLSSKQEMQSIITEAQSRVLKRSNVAPSSNIPISQSQVEKRSYTLYNPQGKGQNDPFESNSNYKMRIIDYSSSTNSNNVKDSYFDNKNLVVEEPPRPSEFSYKSTKFAQQTENQIINNKTIYNYDNYDYNYGNTYENYPPQQYDNNDSYECYHGNDNYEEMPNDYDDYYDTPEQYPYRKSLLPTPLIENPKPKKHLGRPLNRYHDYTERPPWLEESIMISQSCMVRVSLPFPLISEKSIFDIFRNIMIVPKRGIKIELDCEKRQTGYVYVLFSNGFEAVKALKLNNKPFQGTNVIVESMNDMDFPKVCDNQDNCSAQVELPFGQRSPYNRDFCIEIKNVSSEVNEKDVKDFLNISIDNKRIHFVEEVEQSCCLISAVDERMMLKILSFNGAIFRFNTMKVLAISKNQLKAYLSAGKRETKRDNNAPNPLLAARKYLTEPGKNVLSCAKFDNLPDEITVSDLSQLFTSTVIPMNHIIINRNEAVVDFISAATCQKIINDLKSRPKIDFTITAITNSEFQLLKTKFLSNSNGRKSVTNSVNKLPSNTSKINSNNQDKTRVKIKNLPLTVGNLQIKDLIRNFEFQPTSIQICYANGRHMGEAILTFMNAMEAVTFKDEFQGKNFMQRELEILLSDRN